MVRLFMLVAILSCCLGVNAQSGGTDAHVYSVMVDDDLKSQAASLKEHLPLYDVFFIEAMVQRQKGNNDAAFDLLQRCIELNPKASEAFFFLHQYYNGLKEKEKSLDCIKTAAELSPDNGYFMETLASAYMNNQQFGNAITVYEKLYEQNKDRIDLLENLYDLYQMEKQPDKAIGALDRIEAIDGKNERTTYAKSVIYAEQGNHDAAIGEMKALAELFPYDLNYKCMYGEALLKSGRADAAREVYDQILAEEPQHVRTQIALLGWFANQGDAEQADSMAAVALLNKNTQGNQKILLMRQIIQNSEQQGGDSTRVLALFHKLLASDKADTDIASLCAAYMELKQMPRDSIAPVLERILAEEPDNAAARLQLVSYAWGEGDRQRVIDLCRAARQYNPDEMAFYYYQGIAHYQRDELDEALSTFQNGIGVIDENSNPALVADFYAAMGDLLHQKGMAKQAFEAYDSCLMHAPDNIGCLNNYAYYLSERGEQLDKAEQMSYKTIKAEPENPTYLDTYAWILFMQKRFAEAKIYIDQAVLKMDDEQNNTVIFEHAGDIYYNTGDAGKAVELWQKALSQAERHQGSDAARLLNKKLIKKIKHKKYLK